jgi:uncharacterized membrane protein (UPF0127 family)
VSSSFFHAVLRDPGAKHTIRNTRNQRVLAEDVMAAFDSRSRRTGLLKHNSLPKGSAMLIAPTNAVHTFFMRFPIDIAFVTREGTILKACAAVRPWRIATAWNAFGVIELPAGTLLSSDTVAGDVVSISASEQV